MLESSPDVLRDFNRRHELGFTRRLRPLLFLLLVIVAWQLMPVFSWYEPYYYFFATPPSWFGPFCFISTQKAEAMRTLMQVQSITQELLFLPALLLPCSYVLGYRIPDEIRLAVSPGDLQRSAAAHLRRHALLDMSVLFLLPMLAVLRGIYIGVDYLAWAMLVCLLAYTVLCLAAGELLVLAWLRSLAIWQTGLLMLGSAGLYLAFRLLLHNRMLSVYEQINRTGTVSLKYQPEVIVLVWHLGLLLLSVAVYTAALAANRRNSTLSEQISPA